MVDCMLLLSVSRRRAADMPNAVHVVAGPWCAWRLHRFPRLCQWSPTE